MDNAARVAIHFSHRIGAIVTTVVLLILAWRLRRSALQPLRTMSLIVVGALALQIALGLGNILLKFPLWVTVSHNLGGALLLLTLVTLNYGLRTAEPMEHAS